MSWQGYKKDPNRKDKKREWNDGDGKEFNRRMREDKIQDLEDYDLEDVGSYTFDDDWDGFDDEL